MNSDRSVFMDRGNEYRDGAMELIGNPKVSERLRRRRFSRPSGLVEPLSGLALSLGHLGGVHLLADFLAVRLGLS